LASGPSQEVGTNLAHEWSACEKRRGLCLHIQLHSCPICADSWHVSALKPRPRGNVMRVYIDKARSPLTRELLRCGYLPHFSRRWQAEARLTEQRYLPSIGGISDGRSKVRRPGARGSARIGNKLGRPWQAYGPALSPECCSTRSSRLFDNTSCRHPHFGCRTAVV